nr:low temperature requirement protein A [Actinomadura oligospora]
MNFTWFASSYDTDDAAYRALTMVQMAGVLVLAAGVPAAAGHSDYRAVAIGYLVMRLALVAQWIRAGVEDPDGRRTAFRYASGITSAQAGWILWLVLGRTDVLPSWARLPCFAALVVLELAVPAWAERAAPTAWHPHHIAERYGLFAIILFGERACSRRPTGSGGALDGGAVGRPLIMVAAAGLVLLLWTVHTPLLDEPVLRPPVALTGAAAILLLPLAAPRTGVVTVVTAIAGVCVLVTVAAIVPGKVVRTA